MRLTYNDDAMNNIKFIRTQVFKVGQAEFASIVGLTQPAISRWEAGETSPTLEQVRMIREEAKRRALAWDHEWLFSDFRGATP